MAYSRSQKLQNLDSNANYNWKILSAEDVPKKNQLLSALPLWGTVFIFHAALVIFLHLVQSSSVITPGAKVIDKSLDTEFVEERARKNLISLANIGPRIIGSYENEYLAKDFIVREAGAVQRQANIAHVVEIDIQNVSGSYSLDFLGGVYQVYRDIKNVVVKFGPAGGANNSLLVNCHYDSTIGSPGAGDDLTSCCVMLEALRALSRSHAPLTHNILFLFNGAEENLLQGSHGFITQHKWARDVRAFVNLDSAGAGGHEMVFQTGPHPWMVSAYSESAPYPFANVVGQEIFQSGLIPSDTDFRIFRDYGNIPGLDLAYVSNGYVYHTLLDTPDKISEGSIQRAGENLMALLKKLGNSSILPNPGSDRHGAMVFFDVGAMFMVTYPQRLGAILNGLAGVLVFFGIMSKFSGRKQSPTRGTDYMKLLTSAMAAIFVTWVLALVATVTMALFLAVIGRSMSWFTYTANLVVLFVLPAVLVCLGFHSWLRRTVFKGHNPWMMESVMFEASLSLFSLILVATTKAGLCSAYLPMLWVWSPFLIRDKLPNLLGISSKGDRLAFLSLHFVGLIIPSLCYKAVMLTVLELFVPIMGRAGQNISPDFPIGILVCLSTVPFISFQASLVYVTDNIEAVCKALVAVLAVGLAVVIATPLGFPYSFSTAAPRCQRQLLVHMNRNFRNISGEVIHSDSGVWNVPFDYYGEHFIKEFIPAMKAGVPLNCSGPYCGLPYIYPLINELHPSTTKLFPGPRVDFGDDKVSLELTRRSVGKGIVRLTFRLSGPDHISVYLSPKSEVALIGWSISQGQPLPTNMPPEVQRTNYFMVFTRAEKRSSSWQFHLDLQVKDAYVGGSPLLDIASAGFYLHGAYKSTAQIEAFVRQLPDWVCPLPFVSSYDSWVF